MRTKKKKILKFLERKQKTHTKRSGIKMASDCSNRKLKATEQCLINSVIAVSLFKYESKIDIFKCENLPPKHPP